MAHKLCCNASKSTNEASTPTRGGDAFGTRLAKNRWFGSSGLNLAFEGLLLGASLRLRAKVTRNEPHESCFQFMMLSFTQKEHLSSFARRQKVPKVSKRRLQIAGGTEACGTARAESRSRRCRAGDRVEVAASTPAHGSASLECQK
jgi:hypothetical protein